MTTLIGVSGGDFVPYNVNVGRNLLSTLGVVVAGFKPTRVAIISDETVASIHGQAAVKSLAASGFDAQLVTIPAGESSKSFKHLEQVVERLIELGLDRKSLVVALGGGVIGDLAGLSAALFMRGIDFVQVPTTLLAQVDSSVGGKTAIDSPQGKNLIGAFHQPRAVLADIDVLGTLPVRQVRSGWAEVLKHGMICDAAFFEWLGGEGAVGASGDAYALERAVIRSVEIKSQIVGEDEKEAGRRALLNLGHTFGHALEVEVGFDDKLTHGEAVAVGCAMAFRYSVRLGHCAPEDAEKVEAATRAAGLPSRVGDIGHLFDPVIVLQRMTGDKKAEGGRVTLVLAKAIGEAFVTRDVDADDLLQFLTEEIG